ncbi:MULTISPECIES: hypothetical protein [Streptomyces]|uniref:Putative membrane protein n=1 Tax=Streptomyces albus (strain ATCC 21838 / DSM 41398 / FERM P-419 / JCM 4703 / NBRC 107858) TaxID=1081613 RepID=A0A0B5EQU0_STRA4|nr:hypothetical protein [Streptomyces sp. SCSIO ZS0520]AJE83964.1 putative membrane protein [Streptomyces albus]AOU78267.1 putative membrane protein [Streptomyces albus]AYN34020.1 putative membrane protein [Streptomyces albus]
MRHTRNAADAGEVRESRGRTDGGARRRRGRDEWDGMYGWIWRHLPGNVWVRALLSLLLVLLVVFLLFQYIFPWAEPLLPFNDVTVDEGRAGR